MAKWVLPKATTSERTGITPDAGEILYDETLAEAYLGDGSTAGGVAIGGSGVTDGDKGDITVSGSGATWTIDSQVVTFAKFQNVSTNVFIGRDTAGSGSVEELSVSDARTLLGLATVATTGAYSDLTGTPTIPSALSDLTGDSDDVAEGTTNLYMTSAERTKLSGIETGAEVNAVDSVNTQTGAVVLDTDDITEAGNLYYTAERVDDQVNTLLTAGTNITLTYDDGAGTLTIDAAGGGISDGDKGDITVSGSGATWTIDNDAVTFAKMQNVSTNVFIGRDTAGSGDAEELSVSDARTLLGLATVATTGAYSDLSGTPTIPSALSDLTGDSDDVSEGATNFYYTEARVSANTDVAANTAARHDAVTVTDSSEINFTLTGQDITANLIAGSIDETKLDASVNASLDLADSAAQSGDNVSIFTNDSGYITATLTNEQVEDIVGSMVTGNTETLITVTYQDGDGTLDFVVDNDLSNYDNTTSGFITGNQTITLSGDVTGSGTTAITTTIANDAVDIAMLSATGTPSATTFLRGDNTWAVPAGGGGGTVASLAYSYFQATKNSSTFTTTTSFADVTGFDEDINEGSDYTFNTTTGVLTLDVAGDYFISFHAIGGQSASNRNETQVRMMADTGSGFSAVAGAFDKQYASRNTSQDEGSVQLSNFVYSASAGDDIKFQMAHVGVAAVFGQDDVRVTVWRMPTISGGGGGLVVDTYESAEQTITNASVTTLTHGMTGTPHMWMAYLVCKTADINYAVGDVVRVENFDADNSSGSTLSYGISLALTNSGADIDFTVAANGIRLPNATTGVRSVITNGNWRIIVKATAI